MTTRIRSATPRNDRAQMPWRAVWLGAQLTPILFSSYVWLIVLGVAPLLAAVLMSVSALLVVFRNSPAGLWWRFGVRELLGSERERVLAAIVPIGSLRGRRQPARVWQGRRMDGAFVAMPTEQDLVVSSIIAIWINNGSYSDEQ